MIRITLYVALLILTLAAMLGFLACSGDGDMAVVDLSPDNGSDDDTIPNPDPSTDTGPRLTIEEPHYSFGYVPQQSIVSHVFWLKSTGDDTLRILDIKPG